MLSLSNRRFKYGRQRLCTILTTKLHFFEKRLCCNRAVTNLRVSQLFTVVICPCLSCNQGYRTRNAQRRVSVPWFAMRRWSTHVTQNVQLTSDLWFAKQKVFDQLNCRIVNCRVTLPKRRWIMTDQKNTNAPLHEPLLNFSLMDRLLTSDNIFNRPSPTPVWTWLVKHSLTRFCYHYNRQFCFRLAKKWK